MTKPIVSENGLNDEQGRLEPAVRTVYVTRKERHKRSRLSRGWPIVLVIALGVGLIYWGLTGVADEISRVNGSIQEQTGAVQDQTAALQAQTNVMAGIRREIVALTDAVQQGFDRVADEIRQAAGQFKPS
ncbi:hypothetical protein [Paenibacillus thermotolerans]|uniref:hypothetical protein n=1 Tax=Paenibacillus thermotolerans TaxID=3027807 RepID=UPI00236892ED|nr:MULTISPECIES: hypothetical protein [unclassified Paenibacillus]